MFKYRLRNHFTNVTTLLSGESDAWSTTNRVNLFERPSHTYTFESILILKQHPFTRIIFEAPHKRCSLYMKRRTYKVNTIFKLLLAEMLHFIYAEWICVVCFINIVLFFARVTIIYKWRAVPIGQLWRLISTKGWQLILES